MNYPVAVIQEAIINHIVASYDELSASTACSPSMLYLTMTFNARSDRANAKSVSDLPTLQLPTGFVFSCFDLAYKATLKTMLGHYNRSAKVPLQPKTWAFLDLPGSKPWKLRAGKLMNRLGTHIHAIMLVHPSTVPESGIHSLGDMLESPIKRALGTTLSELHIRVVADERADVERMVRYSSALMRTRIPGIMPNDCYDVWPRRPKRHL